MNILIIGGCGYIGSAVYFSLKNEHKIQTVDTQWFGNPLVWRNINIDNIKMDYRHLTKEEVEKFDVVILAAAHSSVQMCEQDKYGAYKNNVNNFVDLVDLIESTDKPIKFIYASSSCVYVETKDKPAVETDTLTPVDLLSYTKTAIDQYVALSKVEYYGLRFGSVAGWSDNFRPDLMINAMTSSAIKNKHLTVSNSSCYRPILGMNDLVRAVRAIIADGKDNRGIYNVSSYNAKIGDIATEIGRITNAEVRHAEDSKTYNFCIDSSKFEKTYRFTFDETTETIVEGIQEHKAALMMVDWTKREMKNVNWE